MCNLLGKWRPVSILIRSAAVSEGAVPLTRDYSSSELELPILEISKRLKQFGVPLSISRVVDITSARSGSNTVGGEMHIMLSVYYRCNHLLASSVDKRGLPARNRSSAFLVAGLMFLIISTLAACGAKQSEGQVFFLEPQDGAQVEGPFMVKMGARGLAVEPASDEASYIEGRGHHHIIVDAVLPSADSPIPRDSVQHLHFGKGESEALLDLESGKHTLRLLFAKGDHVPWAPVITDTIAITVSD